MREAYHSLLLLLEATADGTRDAHMPLKLPSCGRWEVLTAYFPWIAYLVHDLRNTPELLAALVLHHPYPSINNACAIACGKELEFLTAQSRKDLSMVDSLQRLILRDQPRISPRCPSLPHS